MADRVFKRLPYGISNFERLIMEDYVYVDKTRYIEMLENENNKYQFFFRPRKFGKSLFLSVLTNYYDIRKTAKFERLFGGLYIGQNPTPHRNSYAVIAFDFSGLDTCGKDDFKKSFSDRVQDTVIAFLAAYRDFIPDADKQINRMVSDKSGIGALYALFGIAKQADIKLFAIIDEHDHFANDLIATGVNDEYKEMEQANGFIRDFYETLKIGTSSILDRIFITGISPVMMDDLTSGFNIATNLTPLKRYNSMMGFTHSEVDWLMDATGVSRDHITVDMEWYYNGYLFHRDATDRVFNPSMMLYFLDQVINERKIPEKIIDDNLKLDYGHLRRLTRNEANRETLLQIVKDGGIVAEVKTKFSIDRLHDERYFVSLLFYMGLLTIEKPLFIGVRLCIPNHSIRTVFWECIMEEVQTVSNFSINTAELDRSITALALDGQVRPFVEYISRNIFNRLSNRDLRRFDGKYIKIMLLHCLFQSKVYVPVSEMETSNGYVDIFLRRSPLAPEVKYEWLFEFKYFKASEKALGAHRLDAQKQLTDYSRSEQMKDDRDVKKAVIMFIGKNKYELFEN